MDVAEFRQVVDNEIEQCGQAVDTTRWREQLKRKSARTIQNGNGGISDIAGLTATLYQTSPNNDEAFTSVSSELSNVRSYVEIQKHMHEFPFTVDYDVEPETLDGRIIIRCREEGKYLIFQVKNSGLQIECEKAMQALRLPEKISTPTTGRAKPPYVVFPIRTEHQLGQGDVQRLCLLPRAISVVLPQVWQWTGWAMVIFRANLQSIPTDLYEVSEIDGVGKFKQFFSVTLPLMVPSVNVAAETWIFESYISAWNNMQCPRALRNVVITACSVLLVMILSGMAIRWPARRPSWGTRNSCSSCAA